jgi:hypothetical protein
MNLEKQNEFLLKLLHRLYLEVGAYRVFVEYAKEFGIGSEVEAILQQARTDPALRAQIDSYCQILAAGLPLADAANPDQSLRQFLSQLNPEQGPN